MLVKYLLTVPSSIDGSDQSTSFARPQSRDSRRTHSTITALGSTRIARHHVRPNLHRISNPHTLPPSTLVSTHHHSIQHLSLFSTTRPQQFDIYRPSALVSSPQTLQRPPLPTHHHTRHRLIQHRTRMRSIRCSESKASAITAKRAGRVRSCSRRQAEASK